MTYVWKRYHSLLYYLFLPLRNCSWHTLLTCRNKIKLFWRYSFDLLGTTHTSFICKSHWTSLYTIELTCTHPLFTGDYQGTERETHKSTLKNAQSLVSSKLLNEQLYYLFSSWWAPLHLFTHLLKPITNAMIMAFPHFLSSVPSTYKQCTTVRPSPPLYSSCHFSTWRMSFKKERLETGVSLYMGHPRNWNCCTIR